MTYEAQQFLTTWHDAVNARELETLCGLYDPQAVLIPTFSNRNLRTPAAIRGYFVDLAAREDLQVALHERTLAIQDLGASLRGLSGIYRWQFAVEGEPLGFEARFSFVIDEQRSQPILHHHSSQVPRML